MVTVEGQGGDSGNIRILGAQMVSPNGFVGFLRVTGEPLRISTKDWGNLRETLGKIRGITSKVVIFARFLNHQQYLPNLLSRGYELMGLLPRRHFPVPIKRLLLLMVQKSQGQPKKLDPSPLWPPKSVVIRNRSTEMETDPTSWWFDWTTKNIIQLNRLKLDKKSHQQAVSEKDDVFPRSEAHGAVLKAHLHRSWKKNFAFPHSKVPPSLWWKWSDTRGVYGTLKTTVQKEFLSWQFCWWPFWDG